jgi:beta-lactamase class A
VKRGAFVAGVTAAALWPKRASAQSFDDLLRGAIGRIPATVGVYARTMAPGAPIAAYNADLSFPSASTIKVLIMLTAFRLAERDPSVMSKVITFRGADFIGGSDFLAHASNGERFTVHELIVPMIQVSDNTAANILITHFGFDAINATAHHAGMKHTQLRRHFLDTPAILKHHDNRTTPQDMANLLFQIERGTREAIRTVASPESCHAMIQIMLGQTDRDKIPAGIPHGVAVANKTGELTGTRADIAIVDPFGNSPYVLAVYTMKLNDWSGGAYGIADISRVVYHHVAGTML